MSDLRAIHYYSEGGRVGCGWRFAIVARTGRKYAALLFPAEMKWLQIPVAELADARRVKPHALDGARVAAMLERVSWTRARYGRRVLKLVDTVAARLRAMA